MTVIQRSTGDRCTLERRAPIPGKGQPRLRGQVSRRRIGIGPVTELPSLLDAMTRRSGLGVRSE